MSISENFLSEVAFNLLKYSSIYLPNEIKNELEDIYQNETSQLAKTQLKTILKNINIAANNEIGLCQDTGLPIFFIELGTDIKLEGDPGRALSKAVKKATKEIPLRENCIHPLTYENSGTNVGWGIPGVHWDIVPNSNFLKMTAVPKGFGPEIRFAQTWVLTSENVRQASIKAVLDVVQDSLGEPCPP